MTLYRLRIIFILLIAAVQNTAYSQTTFSGAKNNVEFDFDWKFFLGDIPSAIQDDFDDSKWRKLDLPHDFSIEQPFDLKHESGWRGAYLPGGIGWYRKTFNWTIKKNQKVFVNFDGIYMNSEVWINGQLLGKRPYGYISFQYDLSQHLREGKNTIAVKADNSKLPSGRWYTGSGIYRHVTLTLSDNIFIPKWGTYVTTPEVSTERATVALKTEIQNQSGSQADIILFTQVFGPNGKLTKSISSNVSLLSGLNIQDISITLSKPALWSPETPKMYKIVQQLKSGNKVVNEFITWFGVRNIVVNAKDGFVLNGKKIKLNGVCNHHDGGPVGVAVPEDVLHRRLKLLKEMGCNAIRTAHNPAAPEFYAMCDTLGFLVMDEAFDGWDIPKADHDYGLYFNEWWKRDLTDFVKRDRNHPSVVMWSIGNEVPKFKAEQQKEMVDLLKTLDNTRPITQARGFSAPYIDIAGFNGDGEMPEILEKYHKEHPDKPLLGTEITHTLQTRGVYATQTSYRTRDFPAPWEAGAKWDNMKKNVFMIPDLSKEEVFKNNSKFYQSSYDNAIVRIGVRDQHKRTEALNYFIGTFRWTGFDYLGEAAIQPARTANFGILDLAGFPKDHYYLYQSLWSKKPMVHLLPHWTHPGKEGVIIPVVAYTNAESVELFLNGKSLGEKKMTDDLQIVWQVPYETGTLKAVAKIAGKVVAENSVISADQPASVRLIADRKQVFANRRDVVHIEVNIVDLAGHFVPDSDNLVEFEVNGPAKIIGVENGDITDFASMKDNKRKVFKGKCLVMLQTTGQPGAIYLKASSKGLNGSQVMITSRKPG